MVCECISLPSLALFLELVVNSLFSHIDIWQWGRRACVFPKFLHEICLAYSVNWKIQWGESVSFLSSRATFNSVLAALGALIRHFDDEWQGLQKFEIGVGFVYPGGNPEPLGDLCSSFCQCFTHIRYIFVRQAALGLLKPTLSIGLGSWKYLGNHVSVGALINHCYV